MNLVKDLLELIAMATFNVAAFGLLIFMMVVVSITLFGA